MKNAYWRITQALRDVVQGQKGVPPGKTSVTLLCPAHPDRRPSLTVTAVTGMVLMHCHAGCPISEILAALGLSLRDLYDEPRGITFEYVNRDGRPTRKVHRTPEKKFYQSGEKSTCELYRLPQVIDAVASGRDVWLVEGEKDVHALEALGAVATTAPQGACNFPKVDVLPLSAASVVCVPDQDEPGDGWLESVFIALEGTARDLRVVHPKIGKDAADHIAAGFSLDQFVPADRPNLTPTPEDLRRAARQGNAVAQSRLLADLSETLGFDDPITKVVKLAAEPAEYYIHFASRPTDSHLLGFVAVLDSQTLFRRRCLEKFHAAPPRVNPATWRELINDFVACAIHEAPDDFNTPAGRGRTYVRKYLKAGNIIDLVAVQQEQGKVARKQALADALDSRQPFKTEHGTHVILENVRQFVRDATHGADTIEGNRLAAAFRAAGFTMRTLHVRTDASNKDTTTSTWIVERPQTGRGLDD